MGFQFDGANKLIILTLGTLSMSAVDVYSRWKDWVTQVDDSKYVHAFTVVGGDPIGPGQAVAPYIFLNTVDGWKIRPHEANHELRVEGNLYSLDPDQLMFTSTLGAFNVTTIVERSSAAIQVAGSGVDQTTVQTAMTAQGYTQARAAMIQDMLSASVIGTGQVIAGSTVTLLTSTLSSSADGFYNGMALQLFSSVSGSCVRKVDAYERVSGSFRFLVPLTITPQQGDTFNVLSSRLALDDTRLDILPLLLA